MMKSVLLTLAFIICASVIVGAASAQDAPLGRDPASRRAERRVSIPTPPTAYELRCRGASRDENTTPIFSVLDSRPSAGSNSMVTMAMDFERGINPAGDRGEGLKPGQCAWVDRGYGGLEPVTIRFETSSNAQLAQTRHGTEVDRSPTAAERYPDKQTIPVYLSDSNCFWVFRAYTTNQGYLQAVSHQHWKPSVSILDRIVGGSPRSRPPTRRGSSSGDGGRFPPGGLGDTFTRPLPKEVYEPPLRSNEVKVVVRYSKEYGDRIPSGGNNFNACGAFSVFGATVLEPVPGGFGNERQVGSGARTGGPIDYGEYWLCIVTLYSLPFDRDLKVYIRVHSVDDSRTGAWTGGTNAQPPAGQERVITPAFQTVRLTARKTSETVIFDMIYAPLPSMPR